jgi:hypothetical protein
MVKRSKKRNESPKRAGVFLGKIPGIQHNFYGAIIRKVRIGPRRELNLQVETWPEALLGAEIWSCSDSVQSPTSLKSKTSLLRRLQKVFIASNTLVNHMNAVMLSRWNLTERSSA